MLIMQQQHPIKFSGSNIAHYYGDADLAMRTRSPEALLSPLETVIKHTCEALDLPYGIFWANQGGVCVYAAGYMREEDRASMEIVGKQTFLQLSQTYRFPSGLGQPGRVLALGGHEWLKNVQTVPGSVFVRLRIAEASHIRSIFSVKVPGGVVEFGSSVEVEENLDTVRYVQNRFTQPILAQIDSSGWHRRGTGWL